MCVPGSPALINKHCGCSRGSGAQRPSVRPPPPPPSFHPRPGAPSKPHYPALRSARPAQVTTSPEPTGSEGGARTAPRPGSESPPTGRGPVCGASPSLRPGNNSANPLHPAPPAAAGRRPPRPRPAGSPRDADPARGAGRGALRDPRLLAAEARPASSAPPQPVPTLQPPAQPGPPAARSAPPAHTRARTTRSPRRPPPPAARPQPGPPGRPRGPSDGRGARKPLCTGSAGHKLVPRPPRPGAEGTKRPGRRGGGEGAPRGARVGKSAKRSNSRSPRAPKSGRRVPAARPAPGMRRRRRLTVQRGGRGGRSRQAESPVAAPNYVATDSEHFYF